MNLKVNVNKIHSSLSDQFEIVKIEEKSSIDLQEYVEITSVNEGKEVVMIITKKDLNNNKFNWKYYSNPDMRDFLIERNSTVDSIVEDVKDIFEKNRFDSDYLKK
jgi:tRNA U34 5-carboxymethylaminomethyl modifying GTPase MnmE/TrmE